MGKAARILWRYLVEAPLNLLILFGTGILLILRGTGTGRRYKSMNTYHSVTPMPPDTSYKGRH